ELRAGELLLARRRPALTVPAMRGLKPHHRLILHQLVSDRPALTVPAMRGLKRSTSDQIRAATSATRTHRPRDEGTETAAGHRLSGDRRGYPHSPSPRRGD